MKPIVAFCLLAAFSMWMAGCSSTPGKIDTGTISARTFSFINRGNPAPGFAETRGQIHALCQEAITQSLARRQVTRVEQGGDVTVAYLILTGNNVSTMSINDYFGYGRDATKLAEKAHEKYTGNANPNYFEAGTLLIDIIDSKSWKVLRRGYATRTLLQNPTPEQQTARLQEVVEEIFKDVRFKQ